jgi:ABC-type lipoprotein release transport system permease subunit
MTANELADKLQELDSKLHLIELFKSANILRQQEAEIEEWKRKYKDMHNLATQAMSRNHQLEKEAQ